MSCYNCTKKFGFLCSEKGCPDCGFAFCSGCLKHKVADGKATKSVCGGCHKKRQASSSSARPAAPPDALEKRLSALENPSVPHPITVYTGQSDHSRMGRLKRGLSKEDTVIAERLEKLKHDRKSSMEIPTEVEMAERLAALKGAASTAAGTSAADQRALKGVKTDMRSDVERTDDLVAAITAEAAIDSKRQRPEDEVAERLARLKGEQYVPPAARKGSNEVDPSRFLSNRGQGGSTDPVEGAKNIHDLCNVISKISVDAEKEAKEALDEYSEDTAMQEAVAKAAATGGSQARHDTEMKSDSEDEEEEARLVEQILAEARLDDLSEDDETPPPVKSGLTKAVRGAARAASEEELPWCAICNEDAVWRCHGCEGDLYCQTCLKECHDEFEIKDHKFTPYKKEKVHVVKGSRV